MDKVRHKHHGFTMIELIMVISIIGILSVFAFFALQNTSMNIGAQAQQIANDLRYAQSLAMAKGERYRWVKTSSNTYQIQNNAGTAITLNLGNTTVTLNGRIVFGTLTNLPNNLVNFDGFGAPYSDTATPGAALSSNATIPITSGSSTQTITITAETGGVSVS
jgi:prepilin-type N-terminal cleavage/methylation domain-containing protein